MASASWSALGTTATVIVTDDAALDRARAVVERELVAIDRACSRFRSDSELARVNAAAGRPVRTTELFRLAVSTALWAASVTDGIVDPTVGQALVAAGYDRDFAEVRDRPAPPRAVRVLGWRAVELDQAQGTVRVPAGVRLDLGATAKALAADRAARAARALTGTGVLVNLGGDVATTTPAPAGGWLVRVCEDHRDGPERPGQTVSLASGGLATSSTTVRRWRAGEADVHHIVDPAAGRPARVVWRTVSVAAASCVEANTASMAAIVRGAGAVARLEEEGLPGRLVAADGRVVFTGGWPAEERAA